MASKSLGGKGNKISTVLATTGDGDENRVELQYSDTKVIGNGSFGVVYSAKLVATSEVVAIKKVLQDKRFRNRELPIMKALNHPNIVKLKYYFYSTGEKLVWGTWFDEHHRNEKEEMYLNLIMDFIPDTVYKENKRNAKMRQTIPILFIKLYTYQMFRALAYLHALGICHRDIKPQNLLINQDTGLLKLIDFGSAKKLLRGEPNVSYICSRYYRAPELIFGATEYTSSIDVWSAGCVVAELLLGQPMFPGDSNVDQLVEIIKVLGTPTRDQIHEMNPHYTEFKFPQIKSHPWPKVFRPKTPPEAVELVSKLLCYRPTERVTPLQACAHALFNDLRQPEGRLPNGKPFPGLFDFTQEELKIDPSINSILIPEHYRKLPEVSDPASKEEKTS